MEKSSLALLPTWQVEPGIRASLEDFPGVRGGLVQQAGWAWLLVRWCNPNHGVGPTGGTLPHPLFCHAPLQVVSTKPKPFPARSVRMTQPLFGPMIGLSISMHRLCQCWMVDLYLWSLQATEITELIGRLKKDVATET